MGIEINVPTHQSEITLKQYQKFVSIAENNEDDNFIRSKMIEIFCGIPLTEAYKMKMNSVYSVTDILEDVLSAKPTLVNRFVMGGVEYGLIPDFDDMSLGEYIDLDNNVADFQNIQVAMNVLYRPIKDSNKDLYNIVEYTTDNPQKMLDMPLDAVLGSLFFLLNLGMELSTHTILYSNNHQQLENIQRQLISGENGDGMAHFMDSLTAMLQELKISLN